MQVSHRLPIVILSLGAAYLGAASSASSQAAPDAGVQRPIDMIDFMPSGTASVVDASIASDGGTAGSDAGIEVSESADAGVPTSPRVIINDIRPQAQLLCTTTSTIAEDGSTASVVIDGLGLELNNSVGLDQCVLKIDVEAPPGFEYAVEQVVVRGSALLGTGAFGQVSIASEFDHGTRWGGSTGALIEPSLKGQFTLSLDLGEKARVFSSCKKKEDMQIRVNLALNTPTNGFSRVVLSGLTLTRFALRPCVL